MINFYNDFQPEIDDIVLKILYIFELYKNIIKINSKKNTVLSDEKLDKNLEIIKKKEELYNKLLIYKQKNIIELTKLEKFEQAKLYLELAINQISSDLKVNPNKEYDHEVLYDIIEDNKKKQLSSSSSSSPLPLPPPPPIIFKSDSHLEIINNIVGEIVSSDLDLEIINNIVGKIVSNSLTPSLPSPTPKDVLIIKPLTYTIPDVNNKVIDSHQGPENDKMKDALFGENPNYTEFFQFDKSITSKEFNDVTKEKIYDYIWFAGPIININETFVPKNESIEILKSLLKKDGRIIFTLPTSFILDLRKKNEFNNTIKIKDLYRTFLRKNTV